MIYMNSLLNQVANKTLAKEALLKTVEQNSGLIPDLLEGVTSGKATVRYTCARVLLDFCKSHPENVYVYVNELFGGR
jgi:hypothetical protein